MSFDKFVTGLEAKLKDPLPGVDAQMKMSPMGKSIHLKAQSALTTVKQSAVLVFLFEQQGTPQVLLMERTTYNGAHSGQISFPGGKKEDSDKNLKQTALREFSEEMGINSGIEVVGKLSNLIIPPTGFEVEPYVAITHNSVQPKPDNYEVANVLKVPLFNLFSDSVKSIQSVTASGSGLKIKAPCYFYKNKVIWGATAMMLSELESLCKSLNY